MNSVSPSVLAERLESESGPYVLDIRPEEHYQRDAINGSSNLPVYGDLQRGNEESLRSQLGEIPSDREIIVVCKMGIVAKKATKLLEDEGYDAAVLLGGMSGWSGYQNGSIGYKLRSLLWKLR